uniref:Ig-like domain-containing protein n=1 Tax=Denticeps clupeoides TaxID=299321 RepID=A0AAY4ANU3_9TELE
LVKWVSERYVPSTMPLLGECDKVKGYEGGTVTLPCHYDYSYHGALSICWGKGEVPWSKCSDTIIEAKGNKIIFQSAKKYQLLGRVENGNVSLTIFNATMSDSGKYHCRIHISGLFNDEKNTVDLDITKGDNLAQLLHLLSEHSIGFCYHNSKKNHYIFST